MRTKIAVFCLVLACTRCHAYAQDLNFQVYPIVSSDPSALIEASQALVGEGGKVIHDKARSRLLIMATQDQHTMIKDLLDQIDRPTPNVRIEIDMLDRQTAKERGVAVEAGGEVRVGKAGTDYDVLIKPRVNDRNTRTDSSTRTSLMVQSGREATLQVGSDTPHLEWFMSYGRKHGIVGAEVVFSRAGAYLRFKPTVLGDSDLIRIEVTPELRGIANGHQVSVPFIELSTSFTIKDGETLSLGGLDESKDFFDRFLVGFDQDGSSRALSILATPHILDPTQAE